MAELAEPIEAKIASACQNFWKTFEVEIGKIKDIESKRSFCKQNFDLFKSEVLSVVTDFSELFTVSADSVKRARDIVADCLDKMALLFNNEIKDYALAEEILVEADALAYSPTLRSHIEEGLKVIVNNLLTVMRL